MVREDDPSSLVSKTRPPFFRLQVRSGAIARRKRGEKLPEKELEPDQYIEDGVIKSPPKKEPPHIANRAKKRPKRRVMLEDEYIDEETGVICTGRKEAEKAGKKMRIKLLVDEWIDEDATVRKGYTAIKAAQAKRQKKRKLKPTEVITKEGKKIKVMPGLKPPEGSRTHLMPDEFVDVKLKHVRTFAPKGTKQARKKFKLKPRKMLEEDEYGRFDFLGTRGDFIVAMCCSWSYCSFWS